MRNLLMKAIKAIDAAQPDSINEAEHVLRTHFTPAEVESLYRLPLLRVLEALHVGDVFECLRSAPDAPAPAAPTEDAPAPAADAPVVA